MVLALSFTLSGVFEDTWFLFVCVVLRALGEPFLRLLHGQQNVWSGERILTCSLYPGVTHFSVSSCLWDLLLFLVSSSRKQDCSEAICLQLVSSWPVTT